MADGKVRIVIIRLNGTFGAGKTTTAALLTEKSQRLRLFDPESVGYMLRPNLTDYPVTDFRHWDPWRVLTPIVADELIRFSGQSLVAPQTVLEETYWDELQAGLSERGHEVFHVVLEAEERTLGGRIEADQVEVAAKPWRLEHMSRYASARLWIARRADLVLDSTHLSPQQVADRVWDAAAPRLTQASPNALTCRCPCPGMPMSGQRWYHWNRPLCVQSLWQWSTDEDTEVLRDSTWLDGLAPDLRGRTG